MDTIYDPQWYLSYLIRLWQAGKQSKEIVRIQLINPHTNEQWSFQNLAEVTKFLKGKMETAVAKTHGEGHEQLEDGH